MNIKCLKKVVSIFLICCLLEAGLPAYTPAFTIGEEKEVGEKLLYTVRSSFPIMGDPDLVQYINALGQEVLQVAGFQFFDYRFYIVKSDQFNAFAAPSGLIFFYSKLIESMNSEDELVSVLAHEIGHVIKRHLASRIEKGKVVSIATLGLALAAIAVGGGAAAQTLFAGSMAAGQSAQLYFSRQDEMEADQLAYKWLKDLGRNPDGQKKMLQTMRRITRYRSGQVPQYLLTHPNPEDRLDYVESLIAADEDDPAARDEGRDFMFLRFKYRIMVDVNDNASVRAYLNNILTDVSTDATGKIMAQYGLALLDRKENNYEKCLERLEMVSHHFPDRAILKTDKGVTLLDMGKPEEAKVILETSVKNDPFDMYATFNLAKSLYRLNQKDQALQLFLDVSYKMSEFSTVYFEIGRIYSEKGQADESQFYLGKYNLFEGKLKLAKENFKKASESTVVPEEMKKQSDEYLELIDRLKK